MQSFIEKQFPVSKVSKESYKERKANNGQTLTGLGKWWGRKPLVLVRAAIIGALMPASDNPKRDMEVFLKIMSMDQRGLELRKDKTFSLAEMYDLTKMNKKLNKYLNEWFDTSTEKPNLKVGVDKKTIELKIFNSLGYDEKLTKCIRPEHLENLDKQIWIEINHHLGTTANNIQELVQQLSIKRFGEHATVGDCFCGGGSIPFEAARLGCPTFASDLNPIAGLLTWASINILGASEKEIEEIKQFQKEIYDRVDKEITTLGIEHNEHGDRAVSYLYCIETDCPECGIRVPLAPSWVIGKGTKTIAKLDRNNNGFNIVVKMKASPIEMKEADKAGTVVNNSLQCPACGKSTPITSVRRDRRDENGETIYGLRKWEKTEFDFRKDDIYHERLYAIKYQREDGSRYYRHPNDHDLENEIKAKEIVRRNIKEWQDNGLIPYMVIESGKKTDEVIRNRGWTYWHHLFNARQLLILSKLIYLTGRENNRLLRVSGILGVNKCIDWNSRICRWNPGAGNEKSEQTFYNQAYNTLFNFGTRSVLGMNTSWFYNLNPFITNKFDSIVNVDDARTVDKTCHFWITDPPYADAVNYHELSELFLAWDKEILIKSFPNWYADSKRILAVKGDEHFSESMIEIYSNLAKHTPDNGLQIVMFTHSDVSVWAQLALIMWKAGLKVTAAWNIGNIKFIQFDPFFKLLPGSEHY